MNIFFTKKYSFYFYIIIIIILIIVIFLTYTKIRQEPDLVFYYSDDNTISTYSKFNFDSTLILNISGNITDKSITTNNYNKIGYFTEYKMCNPTINNTAYVTNIETFFLKNGSIQIQPAGIQPINFQGNYSITSNTTMTFRIISGTQNYVNAKGLVILKTYDNLERKVSVYFR